MEKKEPTCTQTGITCGYPCHGECPRYEEEKARQNEMYAEIARQEKEEQEYNEQLLKDNNIPFEDFQELLDFCTPWGKLEIVSEPDGTDQDEDYGVFKAVYVDQWSVGMEGDSFEGYIYGKLSKNKWLKVRYSC